VDLIGWRIWYAHESYNSKDNEWATLPTDGVVCLMKYGSETTSQGYPQREILDGLDHYFRQESEDGIILGASNDSVERIEERYPGAEIKYGKWVPDNLYYSIKDEAMKEQEL
jgi:hypothetical protein